MSDLSQTKALWVPADIPPSPMLAQLARDVFAKSEQRTPKWKFRISSDLIVQIQPKPSSKRLMWFDCHAIVADGANAEMFKKRPRGVSKFHFHLLVETEDQWQFKLRSMPYELADNGQWVEPSHETKLARRGRLIAIFDGKRFEKLDQSLMLVPHCLACGKALTDPASMARWIGPECAGTSSLTVPRTLVAEAAP